MASSDIPLQLAETIQTAHIKREPSARHDINPSTAADRREPVKLERKGEPDGYDDDEEEEGDGDGDGDGDDDDDDIPVSHLRPARRFSHLPPIPDLRFEQSYLHSIQDAKSWWMVAWITARDQMVMPMLQGVVYNLAWCGWQHWNKNAQISGNSIGARARRWWYGVNNWPINAKTVKEKRRFRR